MNCKLPRHWQTVTVEDIAERVAMGPFGSSIKVETFVADGVPIISGQHLKGFKVDDTVDYNFITEEHADRLKKANVQKGDVVFTHAGSIGQAAVVPNGAVYDRYVISQRQFYLRCDPNKAVPEYVVAYFKSPQGQHALLANSSQVGVPSIARPVTYLRSISIPLPPLREQRAIAGVLGAQEDKIEQNRRTAEALDRLSRAIFQAWFVGFEPVKAKAAGATSFPSMPQPIFDAFPACLVDSDIGPVPEGWRFSTIGELANRVAMGPFGSDIKTDNFVPNGVPIIRGGNIKDGFVDEDFVYLTEAKADQLANANAFPGDIVITHRGTLGQIGLIPTNSRHRRYVVSQSQMLIRPNPALPAHFLYLFLTSARGLHELLVNKSQTGVPAISRPTTSVKAIRIIVPDQSLLAHFETIVATLFNCRSGIEDESRKLAEMRDYLLPKLLSGSVRVEAAHG